MRILLVGGASHREQRQALLAQDHYHLTVAPDTASGLARLADTPVDLVILEDENGEATRPVSEALHDSDARLLVIRAGDPAARAAVLDAGADDCMSAPPDPGELRARVRALLRRGHSAYRGGQLVYGPLALDPRAHRVRLNGVPVDLSATEYRLLRCLMLNADAVVSRDQLNQEVWGGALDPSSNTPDVYISYLRRHLAGNDGALIQTVRGLGYSLCLTRQRAAGVPLPRTPGDLGTPS